MPPKYRTRASRASTSKLAPGEDTIARTKVQVQPNGTVWLDWVYCPEDGSKSIRRRTKGKSAGQVRMRARETLAGLKAIHNNGVWTLSSPLDAYINQVTKPMIERAPLSKHSKRKYREVCAYLLGECRAHKHHHALNKHSIGSGIKYKALEALLTEIAELHGRENAKQARTVASAYLINRLVRDELVAGNPIAGASLTTLTGMPRGARSRGGKALTDEEYHTVVEYLLSRDPSVGITRGRGRWSIDVLIATKRNAIDQALLQAATGLRRQEANYITWRDAFTDSDGQMAFRVRESVGKGQVARRALVLDDRIAGHLQRRRDRMEPDDYVIGQPSNPTKPWDVANATDHARTLYKSMAATLHIETLAVERTHVWRTTLLSRFASSGVATAVLDAQFGNSEEVRKMHYTDTSDLASLRRAANELQKREGRPRP